MSKRENATMKIACSDRMPNARSTTASMSPNIPEMIVHTTLVTKVDISSSLDQQIFSSTTSNLPDRGCIQVGLITIFTVCCTIGSCNATLPRVRGDNKSNPSYRFAQIKSGKENGGRCSVFVKF